MVGEALAVRTLRTHREWKTMLAIVITMLVILVISAAVVVYVAYPNRGEDLPHAPWLTRAMSKAADAVPTLDETEVRP
jgi:hypothetical protein